MASSIQKCRYELLRLRPSQRMSWIGYATAYHLVGNYDYALNIINDYLNNNEVTINILFFFRIKNIGKLYLRIIVIGILNNNCI